jgi:predicted RNA-binding protein with PIN domain
MSLLIDGYNLLNAVGITGRGAAASSLERSRRALLNFLAESLDPRDVSTTIVVFDSHAAPPGLPRIVNHRGLTVHFASQYDDADALLEELIRADSAPRRLTVVSSDHRIQRAARRRRAKAVDSEAWYETILHQRHARTETPARPPAAVKPGVPLLEEEVERWLRQFGGEELLEKIVEEAQSESGVAVPTKSPRPNELSTEKAVDLQSAPFDNPFPPGYGEDLEEDS